MIQQMLMKLDEFLTRNEDLIVVAAVGLLFIVAFLAAVIGLASVLALIAAALR